MTKNDFDVITVDHWECPKDTGVALLTMPNVPRPLHGLPPRVIMGKTAWDFVRKNCYYRAGYKCEICGEDFADIKPRYAAHELYSYDYEKQEGVFERCVAICAKSHDFIHSGRLITMYKNGNLMYPKAYVLEVVEKGFKLIHDYNVTHPDEEPLRAYATFLEYLDTDLRDDMVALIEKYDMKFYQEHIKKNKQWKGWHLIYGNKRHESPYKSEKEWKEAMQEANKKDPIRQIKNPFKGGVYDEWNNMIKSEVEDKLAGCKNGRISKRKEKK